MSREKYYSMTGPGLQGFSGKNKGLPGKTEFFLQMGVRSSLFIAHQLHESVWMERAPEKAEKRKTRLFRKRAWGKPISPPERTVSP